MTIAPVLFDAFPEDAQYYRDAPYRQCINAGAPSDAIETMSTPYESPGAATAAIFLGAIGMLPIAAGFFLLLLNFLYLRERDSLFDLPDWLALAAVYGLALTVAAAIWGSYSASRNHPKAKAWKKALSDTWATHGADITVLRTLSNQTRKDVLEYGDTLEKIRKSLNRLDPEGDELDVVRYRLQRYIEASNLPALGAKAAAATHVKDPLVRQAAKEYKAMLEQQRLARRALDDSIAEAGIVLATRLQARSDAELIKLVHER